MACLQQILFVAITLTFVFSNFAQQCGNSLNNRTMAPRDLTRVVGGKPSKIGDWPWMAYIWETTVNKVYACSGSVISKNHILSAGHCVMDVIQAIAKIGGNSAENGQEYKIINMSRHPEFKREYGGGIFNDIAIFEIETPIEFSQTIGPICIPCSFTETHLEPAAAMGFGWIHDAQGNIVVKNRLYDAVIPLQAPKHCGSQLFLDNQTQICAGGFQKGTEDGDSGGPLAIYRSKNCNNSGEGTWYQIGLTSTGSYGTNDGEQNGTAGYDHGVYTRVNAYSDWISEVTNGEAVCCAQV